MILERITTLVVAALAIAATTWAFTGLGSRAINRLNPLAAKRAAPWLWVGPAIIVVGLVLLYPAASTIVLSVFDGDRFVGLSNYVEMLSRPDTLVALRNTVLWVIGLPLLAGALGLAVAVLTDRVRYGGLIKTLLFLPIAISAVAAAVIWRFVYDYKPAGAAQTGTLNGIITFFGQADPVAWLIDSAINNPALIATAVWTQAGFCMVIFSAALRSIPEELYEAASIDGASPLTQFIRITAPLLTPTVTVVLTTMAIIALKAFDIIYVMTNGSYDTDALATLMYKELFAARDEGHAGALAVVLMLAVTPIMIANIRQFSRENGEVA